MILMIENAQMQTVQLRRVEVSFFSNCEDDNLAAVSDGDEISIEGETTSESISQATVQASSSGQLGTDEPLLAENEVRRNILSTTKQ